MNGEIIAMQNDQTERQRWMAMLARASAEELQSLLEQHAPSVDYQVLRAPETGLCMVRGRMGGSGRPFNLGEMTVTRCVVQLEDDTTGIAYVTGRDRTQAELAALADALLQNGHLSPENLEPLSRTQREQRERRSEQVATTKVNFFTLVRGEG